MSGINSTTFRGNMKPRGVPNPTRKATKVSRSTGTASAGLASATGLSKRATALSSMVYSRRYLDWNRLTFAYHAVGSQDNTFDFNSGKRVTADVTKARKELNLTALYGCAPATYCQSCKPFGAEGNLFGLVQTALSTVVVNTSRADTPRLILINTGSLRFDLVKGPFTFDDSFIVSPFKDAFEFIPNVPYASASRILNLINRTPETKKRNNLSPRDFHFSTSSPHDSCVDPPLTSYGALHPRGIITRRQTTTLTPGYVTTDDFGTDGDDTPHSKIPYYRQPSYIQANASFPLDKSLPATVDLVFLDYIASNVVAALKSVGESYTMADVGYYLPQSFTTNSYLPEYARVAWQAGVPNCPVGEGVGSG